MRPRLLAIFEVTTAFVVSLQPVGCRTDRASIASEAGSAAASSTPAIASLATPECGAAQSSLLDDRRRQSAIEGWNADGHPTAWVKELATALGVQCPPDAPGLDRAMVEAISTFQLRTAPFATDVNGRIDERTRRDLAMLYPSLRGPDHPCRHAQPPEVPSTLSNELREQARKRNAANATLSASWLQSLQRAWGEPAERATGRFDDATLQRIAWFQRSVQSMVPGIVANGIVDEATREALDKAYARRMDGVAGWLPGCLLRWPGAAAEQLSFMQRVYEVQRVRAAQSRPFVPMVVASAIEEGRTARADVAGALRKLLASARAERTHDSPRTKADLQIVFGYRSATVQLAIWEYHFPARYVSLMPRFRALPEGEHGAEAALSMATHYAARTASPGYSLHNRGVAVDFACVTERGKVIGPTGKFIPAWKRSWCHAWLNRHAAPFGFAPNHRIDEPWHWEFQGP
jgi:hypothetical protein